MENNRATLEQVTWKEVREAVWQVNPAFTQVVDAVSPDGELTLYKASYPFGSTIIDGSQMYLPYKDGSLITLDDPRAESFRDILGYNTESGHGNIPLSIVLDKTFELYIKAEDRVIPFSLLSKGNIFGLWGSLNRTLSYVAPRVWHMTAGVYDLFALAKLTDLPSYKKLSKARGLRQPLPRNLLAQGRMLTQMTQHRDFDSDWHAEVLFFPKECLEKREGLWANFHLFLHEMAWAGTEYWRNKVVFDYIWDSFVKELVREDIRVTPQVVDIVQHLIRIGLGVLPGFCPATDDEAAPVSGLQQDLIKLYGLKHFAPTIMVPRHLSKDQKRYVYWSLQLPSHFESTPKTKITTSTLSMLREVRHLLDRFCKAVLDNRIPAVAETPFYDFIKMVHFDCFHSEPDLHEGIRPSSVMPKEDKTLIECARKFGKRGFSDVSPFVRGCVRIHLTDM